MIKAVIFDMDGLMVDSEPLQYQAFNAVFRGIGRKFPQEDNDRLYIGLSDIDQARDIVTRYDLPLIPEEVVKRKQVEYRKLISQVITPQPGLMELLRKLHELKYKKGIASSSGIEEIEYVIKGLNIGKLIDVYCSAEEVRQGKPRPDIYLLAANKLGVSPSDCLVLEDAPNGVKAAKAAGMMVFAIPGRATKNGDFKEATRKLVSLRDVFPYLQSII